MKRKRLFEKDDYYSRSIETNLEQELYSSIKTILSRYVDQGYSPRDLTGMVLRVAHELECGFILDNRSNEKM